MFQLNRSKKEALKTTTFLDNKSIIKKFCQLALITVFCLLFAYMIQSTAFAAEGELIYDKVHSPALEGNLLGDPAIRDMLIYLPESYETSPEKRYPTIYLLHGFSVDHTVYVVNMDNIFGGDIGDIANELIADGEIDEVIIVLPDASNSYGGSWFERSEVIGDYRDYIARDLVTYIDNNYRTIADREHRAITGHSMGGYGALSLAIEYPDVFGAVAALSPGSPNDLELGPPLIDWFIEDNPDTLGIPNSANNMFYSLAAVYSPNPDNPPYYVDLPVKYPEKIIVQDVWEKWLEGDLASQIERNGTNLSDTKVFVDQGVGETVMMDEMVGIDRTLAALSSQGISYTYDEFDGDHLTHMPYQLSSALKFLSPHITVTAVQPQGKLTTSWGTLKMSR